MLFQFHARGSIREENDETMIKKSRRKITTYTVYEISLFSCCMWGEYSNCVYMYGISFSLTRSLSSSPVCIQWIVCIGCTFSWLWLAERLYQDMYVNLIDEIWGRHYHSQLFLQSCIEVSSVWVSMSCIYIQLYCSWWCCCCCCCCFFIFFFSFVFVVWVTHVYKNTRRRRRLLTLQLHCGCCCLQCTCTRGMIVCWISLFKVIVLYCSSYQTSVEMHFSIWWKHLLCVNIALKWWIRMRWTKDLKEQVAWALNYLTFFYRREISILIHFNSMRTFITITWIALLLHLSIWNWRCCCCCFGFNCHLECGFSKLLNVFRSLNFLLLFFYWWRRLRKIWILSNDYNKSGGSDIHRTRSKSKWTNANVEFETMAKRFKYEA